LSYEPIENIISAKCLSEHCPQVIVKAARIGFEQGLVSHKQLRVFKQAPFNSLTLHTNELL